MGVQLAGIDAATQAIEYFKKKNLEEGKESQVNLLLPSPATSCPLLFAPLKAAIV